MITTTVGRERARKCRDERELTTRIAPPEGFISMSARVHRRRRSFARRSTGGKLYRRQQQASKQAVWKRQQTRRRARAFARLYVNIAPCAYVNSTHTKRDFSAGCAALCGLCVLSAAVAAVAAVLRGGGDECIFRRALRSGVNFSSMPQRQTFWAVLIHHHTARPPSMSPTLAGCCVVSQPHHISQVILRQIAGQFVSLLAALLHCSR